jgi:hypothetical protein
LRNKWRILVGKPQRKGILGMQRYRWAVIVKMKLRVSVEWQQGAAVYS